MCMCAVGAAAYYAAPGADDVKAPSITVAPDPVVDEDDGADFVASGPSRVADLGAGSVRSAGATRPRLGRRVRCRHDRRAAPGKRARGGRRRLAPFQPRARRRTFRRTPGHRAPYVFGVRRRDFAPLRPCRLRGVPTTERSQDRRLRLIPRAGPWACLRRCPLQSLEPTARPLPHQYAITATRSCRLGAASADRRAHGCPRGQERHADAVGAGVAAVFLAGCLARTRPRRARGRRPSGQRSGLTSRRRRRRVLPNVTRTNRARYAPVVSCSTSCSTKV